MSYLEKVDAPTSMPIAHAGELIEYVSFPIFSVISAVTRMQDGTDIEVILIGREGFFGLPLALGVASSSSESMVQLPGAMWRIRAQEFAAALKADALLLQRALAYANLIIDTLAQFAGCNRLHPVDERCARWLLMAHDRVEGDTLMLTHEYLATMLGVRRPGVSVAARGLDDAGFIEYHRGRILIKDRRGLEGASCECYGVAANAVERLLGYSIRKGR